MIQLLKNDFEFIGQVAKHCDQRKLDIAIEESIQFDLKPIFCDFFYDIQNEWDNVATEWRTLIDGGTYTNCRDNTVSFLGLKKALTYLAYSRYIIINSFDDTPNGQVTKNNQWSIPKPLKEMEAYATKYKNMGLIVIEDAKNYICNNKDFFTSYNFSDCEDCGCEDCDGKTKARGYGLRGSNITKTI